MPLDSSSLLALSEIRAQRDATDTIAFVSGNFNIVHPGHLRLLRFAADCADFLVVGVHSDRTGAAIMKEELRLEGIRSISSVDYSFILRDAPADFIAELKPTVVVKGKEHEHALNPELEALRPYGGKLLFSSGDVVFSSIDLLKKQFREFNVSTIQKPLDFCSRHDFSLNAILSVLNRFKDLKVCVIGDSIVDEYISCEALGMSQEDPTLVVTPVLKDRFIGGAAIVAAHAAGLGARVQFYSVVGSDEAGLFLRAKLQEYGVEAQLYEDFSRPTTLKQRFRAGGKTLLRVSHLRQAEISEELQERVLSDLGRDLADAILLIFSDFNYGCLPQSMVDRIALKCKEESTMMVADSQSSSQVGDVARFSGMTLLTPTEREARLATRDFSSGLVVLAETLRKQAKAGNVLLTMGSEGLLIHAHQERSGSWLTDRLPAFNTAPTDISGAGDSLLTAASLALAAGVDIWQSAYLGSLAAACQVGRLGNIPLSIADIEAELGAS